MRNALAIMLSDFNAKVGKEDIFASTAGNLAFTTKPPMKERYRLTSPRRVRATQLVRTYKEKAVGYYRPRRNTWCGDYKATL